MEEPDPVLDLLAVILAKLMMKLLKPRKRDLSEMKEGCSVEVVEVNTLLMCKWMFLLAMSDRMG